MGSTDDGQGRRPFVLWAVVGLLGVVGVGATGGAAVLLADTTGGLAGMHVAMLQRTLFATYLWPGVLLAGLLAAPSFVVIYGLVRQPCWRRAQAVERVTGQHWSWVATAAYGAGLMAWIAVQILLFERSFLQPLVFAVGALIIALSMTPAVRSALPPTRRAAPNNRGRPGSDQAD